MRATEFYINDLAEAFDNKMAKKGTVKFLSSQLSDPHIQKIIDVIAQNANREQIIKGLGVEALVHEFMTINMDPEHQTDKQKEDFKLINDIINEHDLHKLIENIIIFKYTKLQRLEKKSPILYQTAAANGVESSLFGLFGDIENLSDKLKIDSPKFNVPVFYKLIRMIKTEHGEFFPLRSFVDSKYLHNPVFIITPDPKYPDYDSLPTAAATPTGRFIFNKAFCQRLLDFAYLKGLKPKGKKYVSNGGVIPDEWSYIEFLIIHEFMHYTQGDFHYGKIFKEESAQLLNWVGDFRTNYLLVKSGFEQLPIGLYSDDVNYDRQKTYKEMIDVVKAELEKLNDDERNDLEDAMTSDDHEPGNEEGQSGKGTDGRKISSKDVDKAGNDASDQLSKKKEISNDSEINNADSSNNPSSSGGRGGKTPDQDSEKFDFSKIKPTFSWQALIKKFVTSTASHEEDTYQKINKKTITTSVQVAERGVGVVKPGVITYNVFKSALCIDSSGSMHDMIETIYANYTHLLRTMSSKSNEQFALLKFSNTTKCYSCNWKKKSYTEVSTFGKSSKELSGGSLTTLMNSTFDGATNFDEHLKHEITMLLNAGNNVLLASDSDILSGENLQVLKELLHHAKAKQQLFIIFDSERTYQQAITILGSMSRFITFFNKN